jgi:hypothetical protein
VDNGGQKTIPVGYPWSFETGIADDDVLFINISDEQAQVIESWPESNWNLRIELGNNIFKNAGGSKGNLPSLFIESVRVEFLPPAQKSARLEP